MNLCQCAIFIGKWWLAIFVAEVVVRVGITLAVGQEHSWLDGQVSDFGEWSGAMVGGYALRMFHESTEETGRAG